MSCRKILSPTFPNVERPQRSILGPLLFNIDICNFFFIIEDCDIATYADDNTLYLSRTNVEEILFKKLRECVVKHISMIY